MHVEYLYIIISERKQTKIISLYKENKSPQTRAKPTSETPDNALRYAQHNFGVMNQPLSQSFREPLCFYYVHGLYIAPSNS
jgi:hypothetical protein